MNGTAFQIGTRVTGRCVTTGRDFTGTVTEAILGRKHSGFCGSYRYKLTDTGQYYSSGGRIEPIVECAETAPTA